MSIKQSAPTSFSQTTSLPLEQRDLRTAEACQALACKKTKLFDLIAAGEVDSYLDGTVRKVTGASIVRRRQRMLAEAQSRPRPKNRHEKRRSRTSGAAP